MTLSESNECGSRLKSCFPTMTDDQARAARKLFLAYDVEPVHAAIQHHFETHQFVSGADLRAEIERRTRPTAEGRKQAARIEAEAHKQAIEQEFRTVGQQLEATFARVWAIPAREREELRDRVIRQARTISPVMAQAAEEKHPCLHPLMAALVLAEREGHSPWA